MARTLKSIAQAINLNVADEGAGRITWEEFSRRNFALWDLVTEGRPNIIGSKAAKRDEKVGRLLFPEGLPVLTARIANPKQEG